MLAEPGDAGTQQRAGREIERPVRAFGEPSPCDVKRIAATATAACSAAFSAASASGRGCASASASASASALRLRLR